MRRRLGLEFALIFAAYLTPLLPGRTFDWFITENGPDENTGAISLLLTCVFFGSAAAHALRRRAPRMWSASYAGLSLLFFVGAGEEVSWGQQIFHWKTPALLNGVNAQHETNIHNLAFMTGWLDVGRLFAIFTLFFTLLIPLLSERTAFVHKLTADRIPLPAWQRGIAFMGNIAIAKLAFFVYGALGRYEATIPLVQGTTELKETVASVLFLALSFEMFLIERAKPVPRPVLRGTFGQA